MAGGRRHLQRFWGASGDFWQSRWEAVDALFGGDASCRWVWGTFGLTFALYWLVGGVYTAVDLTGRPAFLLRYKMQPGAPYPVSGAQVWRVVRQVLFNQLVIDLPFALATHALLEWRGYDRSPLLPSFPWVLFELAVCVLIEEAAFYYCHRWVCAAAARAVAKLGGSERPDTALRVKFIFCSNTKPGFKKHALLPHLVCSLPDYALCCIKTSFSYFYFFFFYLFLDLNYEFLFFH